MPSDLSCRYTIRKKRGPRYAWRRSRILRISMWQSPHASVTFACMTLRLIADPTRVDLVARAAVSSPACPLRGCATERAAIQWANATPSFLSPSRRTLCCCLKHMNSCATALGEHFPSTADHPPLLASSSGSVLRL